MTRVYLIHFESPFHHARHYVGCTRYTIETRMRKHRNGTGAKLLRAVSAAGIRWRVVRVWEGGDWELEKRLKARHRLADFCPVCQKEKRVRKEV